MSNALNDLTSAIDAGHELTAAEISAAAAALLIDDLEAVDAKAGFLRALALRGETSAELTGFVKEFLQHAVRPPLDLTTLDPRPLMCAARVAIVWGYSMSRRRRCLS